MGYTCRQKMTNSLPPNPVVRPTDQRKKKACKSLQRADKAGTTKKSSHKMVNSVVKGVSKLTLCASKPLPPSTGFTPVDLDALYSQFEFGGNDDGSHTNTTETASTSRSGCSSSSPLSPSRICQGPSVRHSLEPVATPIPTAPVAKYSETLTRWSGAQQQHFASRPVPSSNFQQDAGSSSDDGSSIVYQSDEDEKMRGVDVDAFIIVDNTYVPNHKASRPLPSNNDGDRDGYYEAPPLCAQTNYAREQLLKSNRYREQLKKQSKKKKEKQSSSEDNDDYSYEMDDNECYEYCDEVEISRGLGGYEEGFGVPSMNADSHEFHHLPLAIQEENDEWSMASSIPEFEFPRSSRTSHGGSTAATQDDIQSI